jgi:hydroxymethylbilane synthase
VLPAPGQGALAVEARAAGPLVAALRAIDDPTSRATVTAERALLATLEGGCSAPIGALGEVAEGDHGDELWIRAVALSPDGSLSVRMSATGTPEDAADLGARLARDMLAEGAGELTDAPSAETVRRQ